MLIMTEYKMYINNTSLSLFLQLYEMIPTNTKLTPNMLQPDIALIKCCPFFATELQVDGSDGHSALASLLVAGMMSLGVTCASI